MVWATFPIVEPMQTKSEAPSLIFLLRLNPISVNVVFVFLTYLLSFMSAGLINKYSPSYNVLSFVGGVEPVITSDISEISRCSQA